MDNYYSETEKTLKNEISGLWNMKGVYCMKDLVCSPVVKWAGGKRQLLPVLKPMMPEFEKYFEPFFGGGALYFDILPDSAVINDFNPQLVNVYKQIKKSPSKMCETIREIQDEYNGFETDEERTEFYYKLRDEFNEVIDEKSLRAAALLIFLNKAGFNGLYRVNSSGKYNVPPAHRKRINAFDEDNIKAISKALKGTRIMCGDFEKACKGAEEGDFVFFDSPYYDTFDTYQAGGFSESDHIRLFNLFKNLTEKGVKCMLTNNDCEFIKELYSDYNIKVIEVKRMINCDGNKRTGREVVITNY